MAWAAKCRETYDRLIEEKNVPQSDRPLLLAVVQGGRDPSLRRECAERLLDIGFDGYGYGGWPVDQEGKLDESVARVAELTPGDRPRFALGIGKPENLVRAFELGYRLFDCVLPTRDARHQRLYVFNDPPERCVRRARACCRSASRAFAASLGSAKWLGSSIRRAGRSGTIRPRSNRAATASVAGDTAAAIYTTCFAAATRSPSAWRRCTTCASIAV